MPKILFTILIFEKPSNKQTLYIEKKRNKYIILIQLPLVDIHNQLGDAHLFTQFFESLKATCSNNLIQDFENIITIINQLMDVYNRPGQ